MGYTNYWKQNKSFTDKEWKLVKDEYDYLKEVCEGINIDETKKTDEIVFNGIRKKEEDHETFVLTKQFRKPFYKGDNIKFNFCKTARKPYDLAVWHLLTFVKMIAPNSIDIRRDGWSISREDD